MISAAIIICALVISFFEKKELFKKPISVGRWTIIAIMIGTAIFSFVKECNGDTDHEHDTKTIDSLNSNSKSLLSRSEKLQATITSTDSTLKKAYNLSLKADSTGKVTITNNNYFSTSTVMCPIEVIVSDSTSKRLQTLCNGDKIPLYYHVNKDGLSFTVPYMKGKDYAGGFSMDGISLGAVHFNKTTGTFNVSSGGMVTGRLMDNHMSFSANVPYKVLK